MSNIYYQSSEESFDNFFERSISQAKDFDDLLENFPINEQSSHFNLKLESLEAEACPNKSKSGRGKRFICFLDTCRREFPQLGSLQKHERIHRGEKPYVCEVCDRAFTQRPNLKRHERLHTGEKPCSCVYCPKKFSNISNLKQHLQIHHDPKNRPKYSCKLCSRASYCHQSSLRKHVKQEHKGNLNSSFYKARKQDSFDGIEEELFSESQLRKIVKFEIGCDEKKMTSEFELQVNEEEMNDLPQNYKDILSNTTLMRKMQQTAIDSATQGSNPVECFERILDDLSTFFDMDKAVFFPKFAENNFFSLEKQETPNTHSTFGDASTPEVFIFESPLLKIENERLGFWEKNDYFEMYPFELLSRNETL